MDIIDIVLAKSLTPQQLATYIAQAQEATQTATTAANNIEAITEQTNTNNTNAAAALANVNAALNNLSAAADTEIDKLSLSLDKVDGNQSYDANIDIAYPSGKTVKLNSAAKYYKDLGPNNDGAVTQATLTNLLSGYSDAINNLNQQIEDLIDGGAAGPNLDPSNSGSIVKVGEDGSVDVSNITEEEIIQALIQTGNYNAVNAVGIEIDYVNGTYKRTQDAANDPLFTEKHPMFCGRMRCNVTDDGRITAWYGDSNYKEDGSNGQVMVYQPKFYYMRVPLVTSEISTGIAIRKEVLILSETAQPGFKVHPLFIGGSNEEVDYALLSAYEGCLNTNGSYDLTDSVPPNYTTKLSSIAGAKPASGLNTYQDGKIDFNSCAQGRGTSWTSLSIEAISAQQMLMMVEFGTANMQSAYEGGRVSGITSIEDSYGYNCSSITGSTSFLGNDSGAAIETTNEINGVTTVYSEEGKRAISYRGYENPWGNMWQKICNVIIPVKAANASGREIKAEYTRDGQTIYVTAGFYPATASAWISAFGKPNDEFDYLFFPVECTGANSAVPVGDNFWGPALTGTKRNGMAVGGPWNHGWSSGPFYYACDQEKDVSSRGLNGRLLYVPYDKDTTHDQNVTDWTVRMEGI